MKTNSPKAEIIIGDSRFMDELADNAVDLIITSPPYWHIKDYGHQKQIGYGQSLHEYLKDLYRVWQESFRVLKAGRRLCINIGDQFARSIIYGRYKIIPLHAEIIAQCERIGFDYMGSIIWQKKTTMNTTGGANVMGSYPFPPNGMIEIDYEFILIFKKPGNSPKIPRDIKEKARLSLDEWKEYFSGHWYFGGAKQVQHEAMFPEELPRRLIKMYSFPGETILDPFLGSGTTAQVALSLDRRAIGYEINKDFLPIIEKKLGMHYPLFQNEEIVIKFQQFHRQSLSPVDYTPSIQDATPVIEPQKLKFKKNQLYKIVDFLDERTLLLDTGLKVRFKGVIIKDKERAIQYYKQSLLKKEIFLKFEPNTTIQDQEIVDAYVYLKNKLFINAYLIKSGIGVTNQDEDFSMKDKFLSLEPQSQKAPTHG